MADISNIITVTILEQPSLAARDNINVVGIITQETGVLSTAERYRTYSNIGDVATDWGTESQVYSHAAAFFGQNPNAINGGGILVVGWHRAVEETVAATAANLTGGVLDELTLIPQLQAISDGSFDIDVDGGTENITGMDFRVATDLDEVAAIIDAELTGADCAANSDDQLVITSKTTGATSLITVVTDPGSGTYMGDLLALAAGTGAVATQGAAAGVNSVETPVACITEIKAQTNLYGFTFITEPSAANKQLLAAYAQSANILYYETFDDAANLEIDVTNPVWLIKLSGYKNCRMSYSAAGNRRLSTCQMARMHAVNLRGENTAITMHLKELNVTAESYTQTEITKAKKVGLDIYTTTKLTPELLTSGANDFTDNRYNLIGYKDAIETDLYNLLHGTTSKIPQTTQGVNALVDQCEKTTREYVRAGVFAPGTWTSTDYFGDRTTFERQIAENGFYFLAGKLSDQSQADRAARKSPVIQGAVKNAGAIHSVDVIINFEL